jgi:hypothetical protein
MKYKIKFTSLFCVLNPSFFPVDVITTHCEPRKGRLCPSGYGNLQLFIFIIPFYIIKA